jgi:uncharacterized membrane protein
MTLLLFIVLAALGAWAYNHLQNQDRRLGAVEKQLAALGATTHPSIHSGAAGAEAPSEMPTDSTALPRSTKTDPRPPGDDAPIHANLTIPSMGRLTQLGAAASAAVTAATEVVATLHQAATDAGTVGVTPVTLTPTSKALPTMPAWLNIARGWLFTGNLVAKLGLAILFIGVGFLVKYVAQTVAVPIELRLAGVATIDLALLAWGFRMREHRRDIGLPAQGTAIAVLMMVVFGAYARYELFPSSATFCLLVILTGLACFLAVLQNSVWLAAFGITGGFAVPLLVSGGHASQVGLFSYYALLNAGVFCIAFKRAWRPLNLLSFAFTFVVATAWGILKYSPTNYVSAQAFLLLFFLFYIGIALCYAWQQQMRLKNYVDSALVLGTPLIAFGLQAALVQDTPYGLAISSLVLACFYLCVAGVLWKQGAARWQVLIETFAALGVIFGTLSLPFALNGRWTSASWALEGTGFVWLGLQRRQKRTWMFGLLMQVAAGVAFVQDAAGLDRSEALASNLWLSFLVLSISAFATSISCRKHQCDLRSPAHENLPLIALAIAAAWFLAGSSIEAILRTAGGLTGDWIVASAIALSLFLYGFARRAEWGAANEVGTVAQLIAAAAVVCLYANDWHIAGLLERGAEKPLLGVFMLAVGAFSSSRMVQRANSSDMLEEIPAALLIMGTYWWFGPMLNIAAGRLADMLPSAIGLSDERWMMMYAIGIAASASTSAWLAGRMQWKELRWLSMTSWAALSLLGTEALWNLYITQTLPSISWAFAIAALLASTEHTLLAQPEPSASLHPVVLKAVHLVRTAGIWLAIWPVGSMLLERWLPSAWSADNGNGNAWINDIPAWGMIAMLAWLARASSKGRWPTHPLATWYDSVVIRAGTVIVALIVVVWNLVQDGTMAPLPYLPLVNPLDLTTASTLALCIYVSQRWSAHAIAPSEFLAKSQQFATISTYVWLNLVLLRSLAYYLGIGYSASSLLTSHVTQAILSLVWSVTALVLMRYAATKASRKMWTTGAALLGLVVLKLFLVDLDGNGSMARVVSFIGVGMLMVLVGYVAPYPKGYEKR